MKLLFFFSLLALLDIISGLCFGGGGGGCGGCGGGCGRRKKRSIEPPPFINLAGKGDQMLCNSPELKEVLIQNMRDTPSESGKSVAAHLDEAGDRYVVVCSENHFEFFIHPDMEFCAARNTTHNCQAFAL